MTVPTPEELYNEMIDNLMQDPDTYDTTADDIDYEAVSTPDAAKDGSIVANISLRPTSTTRPDRPRTVAAGYDKKNHILTVVFPDGTWYNYYDVPEDMWAEFKYAESKGRYMRMSGLDNWPSRGEANVNSMSASSRTKLNTLAVNARAAQQESQGIQGSSYNRGKVVTINGQQYRM
jgi:hypothetical protein